jgi:hypothetical protein
MQVVSPDLSCGVGFGLEVMDPAHSIRPRGFQTPRGIVLLLTGPSPLIN